jgi:hypothetical protein
MVSGGVDVLLSSRAWNVSVMDGDGPRGAGSPDAPSPDGAGLGGRGWGSGAAAGDASGAGRRAIWAKSTTARASATPCSPRIAFARVEACAGSEVANTAATSHRATRM